MCSSEWEYPKISERVNHPLNQKIVSTSLRSARRELDYEQTADRIELFGSGNYASQNLVELLDRARVDGSDWITMTAWSAPDMQKPTFGEAVQRLRTEGKRIEKGHQFGPSWSNHWVQVDIKLPPEFVNSPYGAICK